MLSSSAALAILGVVPRIAVVVAPAPAAAAVILRLAAPCCKNPLRLNDDASEDDDDDGDSKRFISNDVSRRLLIDFGDAGLQAMLPQMRQNKIR